MSLMQKYDPPKHQIVRERSRAPRAAARVSARALSGSPATLTLGFASPPVAALAWVGTAASPAELAQSGSAVFAARMREPGPLLTRTNTRPATTSSQMAGPWNAARHPYIPSSRLHRKFAA